MTMFFHEALLPLMHQLSDLIVQNDGKTLTNTSFVLGISRPWTTSVGVSKPSSHCWFPYSSKVYWPASQLRCHRAPEIHAAAGWRSHLSQVRSSRTASSGKGERREEPRLFQTNYGPMPQQWLTSMNMRLIKTDHLPRNPLGANRRVGRLPLGSHQLPLPHSQPHSDCLHV